ncbi:MAG: RnfABCDGE type electron transport complex subunit B [Oscillospiraceae bacterium]
MSPIVFPVVAVTIIGLILGLVLSIASKVFAVQVDERVTQLREALPGANCGGCGFAGCDEYSAKMVSEGAPTNKCAVGGAETAKKLSAILGVDCGDIVPKVAVVKCKGHTGTTEYKEEFVGPQTCLACSTLWKGRTTCPTACLGFGDCANICPQHAIKIVNNVAVIDRDLCIGCGMCAKQCPNHVIELMPKTSNVFVACSNTEKGLDTKKNCTNGCIGCGKCEKNCPGEAITVTNNVAHVDYSKCCDCGICVAGCPTKAISFFELQK